MGNDRGEEASEKTVLGLLTRTKTSVIGVDFGTSSLRAVQLRDTGDGWQVHHWVNVESEPTTPDPPAFDHRAQIQLAFGPATFSGRRTALVLSPPDVEYRLIDVPSALIDKPSAELRTALQFEFDRQMPWPAAESEIAAWPIKAGATGNTNAMVVAARTSIIEGRLEALEGQQLECRRVDIVPNAVIHVCSPPGDPGASESKDLLWGVLDIGFRSARLYLIHAGRPVYARVLRGGGRELTQVLAAALHIDFRIAEQYKRIYGIRKTDRGFRSVVGGLARIGEEQLPDVLYAILRSTLEEMASDIARAQWPLLAGGSLLQLVTPRQRPQGHMDHFPPRDQLRSYRRPLRLQQTTYRVSDLLPMLREADWTRVSDARVWESLDLGYWLGVEAGVFPAAGR